jgi:hypothetical protein
VGVVVAMVMAPPLMAAVTGEEGMGVRVKEGEGEGARSFSSRLWCGGEEGGGRGHGRSTPDPCCHSGVKPPADVLPRSSKSSAVPAA